MGAATPWLREPSEASPVFRRHQCQFAFRLQLVGQQNPRQENAKARAPPAPSPPVTPSPAIQDPIYTPSRVLVRRAQHDISLMLLPGLGCLHCNGRLPHRYRCWLTCPDGDHGHSIAPKRPAQPPLPAPSRVKQRAEGSSEGPGMKPPPGSTGMALTPISRGRGGRGMMATATQP